jgi:peptide/nickel transport system permease protein
MLPNVMHLVTISAVMDFSGMVLAEAVLSYVGVGVDPTMNSFGTMINAARFEISREPVVWWLLAAAFFFMLALVLAANLFADAVQEAFDPRRVMRRPRPRLMEAKRA